MPVYVSQSSLAVIKSKIDRITVNPSETDPPGDDQTLLLSPRTPPFLQNRTQWE